MAVGYVRHHHSMGNFKMVSVRVVSRSVLNHPFLIIMVLVLIFLHCYFPFLFSLLVTASPVLICTAVLLGTLLIHGKPNDKNVDYNEEMSYNCTPVTSRHGEECHTCSTATGVFSKDIFSEVRNGIIEKGVRTASGMVGSGVKVDGDKLNWESHGAEFTKGTQIHKADTSNNDFGFANFGNVNFQTHFDQDYDKTIKVHEDVGLQYQFESSPGQKKLNSGAEKSSFDALVADVFPTAQETHPLLDSQDPLHVNAPHDDASLKFEFQSLDSNQSSQDSGDDENDYKVDEDDIPSHKDNGDNMANAWIELEKRQHLESLITRTGDDMEDDEGINDVDIDENDVDEDEDEDEEEEDDDDEEGENTDVEKDEAKHVTMWTEEDEKNLRLVGNSELERDLRLENLLARRRVKRNFSMISVRNSIELDRPDHLPFQVPHISTTRVNPFDTRHDTNKEPFSSMPPIPGSAPSVSVPRKNPFDFPCTSPRKVQNIIEEIPEDNPMEMNLDNNADEFYKTGSSSSGCNNDHIGNVLKPHFVEKNRKDAVFRRYDSFSIGHNFPGDMFRKSNFMETDRRDARLKRRETFNARSSFSNSLRPPEKLSFLKMKPVFVPEQVFRNQEVRHSSGRESSNDSESSASFSESDIEDVGPSRDLEANFEHHQNRDGIADDDHASNHSEDLSNKSSEEIHFLHDDLEGLVGSSLEVNAELHADQIHQKVEASQENDDNASNSSTSMISEVVHGSEKIAEDEDEIAKDIGFSPKASSNVSDAITEPPVFDSSPSGVKKITLFYSSPSHG